MGQKQGQPVKNSEMEDYGISWRCYRTRRMHLFWSVFGDLILPVQFSCYRKVYHSSAHAN
jgi:hypothetical protein